MGIHHSPPDGRQRPDATAAERPRSQSVFKRHHGGVSSGGGESGGEVYWLGLIDILTTYSFKKKSEHTLKSIFHDSVPASASCATQPSSLFSLCVCRVCVVRRVCGVVSRRAKFRPSRPDHIVSASWPMCAPSSSEDKNKNRKNRKMGILLVPEPNGLGLESFGWLQRGWELWADWWRRGGLVGTG